ncbi:hypothetical protein L7F22_036975 [Adiantum nelumboides]|nr:hypothetical protein [Adiantum nelumboides]
MVKAKQSATPSTSAAPPPTASLQLVPLNYNTLASSSILARMFSALQSSAILPDDFPQSKSPFSAEDLADAFNPSLRWGNSAKNLQHYITGFMHDASMPYDEQMADELDFNLANAFPEPDSISDSEPKVINENDEVRRLNPVKMETDDVKVEEPSTSASTSSTSLKGVSKIGDMTIIDIDGLNQEQVWKVFEFIYNSVYYGVRYKELTQRETVIMITVGFQGMLRYWWDDLNEASKTFILQGGIPKNFENVITLFFAAMVIQFLGSQQKIKDMCKEAFFREKYEYEVVYCNRFEKHDIPISEYMQYESEEDETSDSTSSESPTEAVSTFSDDTSSVMFNMVRKPYAFPKKAKVRAESSSSSPSTTSGSEESEPSWMKKRRPSTLNLSKKEQRDYRPLPLFSNMVEQAEEIAKTEEWRRMIHPDLRQNQGNLTSPVLQQTTSTNFAIPKIAAKPSPSVVEKELQKERQDRYCAEEHQLKAIQAMFSALEHVNNKIEQLHKLVLNTQSQSAAIEAKVDQCHGELQYLIDKVAMSEIAKEPVAEWKLQRPVNTCQIAYRMIARAVNTCLPSVYNAGYLCNDQSQEKGQNIVMKVDPTSQGSLPDLVQWQEVEFSTEWKLDISKTLLNEAQQPMKMSIERLGLTDQYKLLGKSKSCKDLGLLMQRPQYKEISESVSSNRPSSSRRQAKELTLCLHPETYKDTEGLYRCKLCNKLIASVYLQNGVTVLTKEQVAEKELKYSEPYILPPANARLQPMESASNWHINALKEIAELQYSIISRIDAMVKAKQSATPLTSATPPPTASQYAEDLADAFNTSLRWGNSAKNLSALHHRYTCGEMVCQLSNPEDYLWQGFMDGASMPYDEQMADELDFNLANAFLEPDSISDSKPKVINENDEVKRLNPVKMETDDVKVEEPSTSASTSSTSLKGVSKIGDMTIIDIDGLNQEQVWKVFEFIYDSVHYGVRYKELTQHKAVIMITARFQGMLRYWWDDLNEASKTFILQGGIPKNFENVITLFFAAMVIQFLGSQQKIKDRYKEAFFRGKLCDLTKIKAYQQHMTHLMYQFPGEYFKAKYKQYYVNSFPSSFSNLVKEWIKSAGLQIDDQITLAQINAFIDEVTDLECGRLRMKKEFKQVKGFNSSFCNKEIKSKDFGCAAAEKKCSCKVKNHRNKYGKKYKVARRTCKLSKEERNKVCCYICQKEGHIALECPKCKKRFGNAVLPEKYEYEVVYCNRFEKHDIPISEYMQYESEEDETSDSTSSESPTEAVSTFSDDTSSVMFNMVRKPYAFPKKAKVRAESSSSSPSTTLGSEESEPSWMKKRRQSTLNLSKKEQRDYRPLSLFSNMVEQAEEIAKTEEWRRMIHPGLRQNQEDKTSDSTSFESPTEAVLTFSNDTSSVMFDMVRKPYAFPKKAKVRAESSSSSPSTTSGSEESKLSWMKKRRPSTLNLSKKEQRDYRPLPLFSNMVEQAEEIAKTDEWRRMIHPNLRQNQGNLTSPVVQQTASIDSAIPKTAAKPSPSIVEKQLEKERQDRYCAKEHQLKAIQAMFSALEQVNNKIEQLHKLVLNTQSQSAAIEAKVDQCHGELQYLIDKAAMSEIAKEHVSEWKLQRPINTCQVIPFNEKEHVSYFSEVWIKLPKIPSFRVDALWDTGAALFYLNQELVPPQLRQKLRDGIPISYANNFRGQINQTVQC